MTVCAGLSIAPRGGCARLASTPPVSLRAGIAGAFLPRPSTLERLGRPTSRAVTDGRWDKGRFTFCRVTTEPAPSVDGRNRSGATLVTRQPRRGSPASSRSSWKGGMSIGPAYLARVFPDPWPHELSLLATAGGPDAIDCVTDRMADAGLVRRRGDSGFEPRHKADARIDRWRQKAGGV